MKSTFLYLITGIFILVTVIQCDKAPTAPDNTSIDDTEDLPKPVLVEPSQNAQNTGNTVKLSWEEIKRADKYQLQISESQDFGSVNVDSTVSGTVYTTSSLSSETTYYWRVKAIKTGGNSDREKLVGPWSEVWQFTNGSSDSVDTTVELLSPDDGQVLSDTNPTLNWDSTSVEANYHYQISKDANFSEVVTDSVVGLTKVQASQLQEDQQYYWRVVPVLDNQEKEWSEVYDFIIESDDATTPRAKLVSPSNGATELETSLTLSWESLSEISDYQVQVGTTSNFSDPLISKTVSGTSHEISGLSKGLQYYWRVQATSDGISDNWSSIWDFETKAPDVPAVTLSEPSDGATGLSTSPTLSWESLSGIGEYQLQVSTSSDFSNPIVDNSVTGTSQALSGLSNGQQYYWRVQANGDNNTTNWSSVRNFTTEEETVPSVTLVAPSNGATGLSTSLNLEWEALSGVNQYQVQVSTDSNFSNIILDETASSTLHEVISLANDQQYYWRVQAIGDNNSQNWSNTWNFATKAQTSNDNPEGSVAGDRQALMDLYSATSGSSWSNDSGWGSGDPSGSWYGVEVNSNGRVVSLNLRSNNLSGNLPSSLGNLTKLEYLNLKQNYLTGTLPGSIGNMESLRFLLLSGRTFDPDYTNDHHPGKQDESTNEFTGQLPSEWGDLPNIEHLELSHNSLSGNIPTTWGNMTTLRGLWLNGNGLSGTLPPALGNLSNLRNLTLSHNNYTGQVPTEWSNMGQIRFVRLNHNSLEGNFDSSFSNWTNLNLFYLNKNNFSGEFPSFLVSGNLPHLATIGLAHNSFSGELPDFQPLLSANIYVIELDLNNFSGPIPPEITQMEKAKILAFGWNNFSGELPQSGWSNLDQLRFFRVRDNDLTGAIPSELPDNPKLKWLWFQNNDFTSADPYALGDLSSDELRVVDISGNHLDYAQDIEPAVAPLSDINFNYGDQTAQ